MIVTGSIIIFAYLITMIFLLIGYEKIPLFISEKRKPFTRFSIIIPFRNEAENLPELLNSIQKLNYPKDLFEIILVDDDSEDNSVKVIEETINVTSTSLSDQKIQYKIIKNNYFSASPKKDAITNALKIAQYDWIITTDADCILPKNWLASFDAYIQMHNPIMIVGPVRYIKEKGLVNSFQQLDNFSLQTTTIAGFGLKNPLLCNGANLAYKKEAFNKVHGFKGNDHIASGDDIFLLEKLKRITKGGVHYLKSNDAIVVTSLQKDWKGVIGQRIRWASKTTKQKNILTKGLGMLVFLCNLFVIIGGIYSVFKKEFILYYLIFLIFKIVIDFIYIKKSYHFFNEQMLLSSYFINVFIYPFLTVIIVYGSLRGNYSWKGRRFNTKI